MWAFLPARTTTFPDFRILHAMSVALPEHPSLRRCWHVISRCTSNIWCSMCKPGSPAYLQQAGSLTRHLLSSTAAVADAQTKAILVIYRSLQAQASVLSYIDILQYLSIICGCMIPLVLLMKRPPKGTQAAVH